MFDLPIDHVGLIVGPDGERGRDWSRRQVHGQVSVRAGRSSSASPDGRREREWTREQRQGQDAGRTDRSSKGGDHDNERDGPGEAIDRWENRRQQVSKPMRGWEKPVSPEKPPVAAEYSYYYSYSASPTRADEKGTVNNGRTEG